MISSYQKNQAIILDVFDDSSPVKDDDSQRHEHVGKMSFTTASVYIVLIAIVVSTILIISGFSSYVPNNIMTSTSAGSVLVKPLWTADNIQTARETNHLESSSWSQQAFIEWGKLNLVTFAGPAARNDNDDEMMLRALGDAIQDANIVLLTEGDHNSKEMMQLHHRVVQYFVQELGFNTIVTETDLPESREIYDYVLGNDNSNNQATNGNMWQTGLSEIYSEWEEGRALVEWIKHYNQDIAKDADQKLHYYGMDIGGKYMDWRPPISKITQFLKRVGPAWEAEWFRRIDPMLTIMGNNARTNYDEKLSLTQKRELADALDDAVEHFYANEESYVKQTNRMEYEWARQSAVAMQLAENYYRNNEEWRSGIDWKIKSVGNNGREIAMARNILWAMQQRENVKVIVIGHAIHTKTATQFQDDSWGFTVPAGQMLRGWLAEEDCVVNRNLFVLGMLYGGGTFWKNWQNPQDRFVDTIRPALPNGLESSMNDIRSGSNFYLPWENVTLSALPFLTKVHEIRQIDSLTKLLPLEWNAYVYFETVGPASPA